MAIKPPKVRKEVRFKNPKSYMFDKYVLKVVAGHFVGLIMFLVALPFFIVSYAGTGAEALYRRIFYLSIRMQERILQGRK